MKSTTHLPTLRQMQYLVAVVELKHFGKAAERCFVTQSTLSAGIQELEELLDTRLLERTKRRVMPTELGLELAEKARNLLALAADMVAMTSSQGDPLSGALSIGIIPTVGPFLLPRVLPLVRARYPDLKLTLIEDQTARLIERIESGELDGAILGFPFALRTLEHQIFWQENFVVAIPRQHSLASRPQISTHEIPAEELLLLEEGHCLTDHALSACRLEGLKAHAAFQGTSLYTLVQMVAGGQGITFLPEMALDRDLMQNGEVVLTDLSEPGPHREIGLVWRPTCHRKEDLKLLAREIHSMLKEESQPAQARSRRRSS